MKIKIDDLGEEFFERLREKAAPLGWTVGEYMSWLVYIDLLEACGPARSSRYLDDRT
jgi:hypothetical protein